MAAAFTVTSCTNNQEKKGTRPVEKKQEATVTVTPTRHRLEYFKKKKVEIDKQIQSASPSDRQKKQQLTELSLKYDSFIDILINTHQNQNSIRGGHEDQQALFPYQAALVFTGEQVPQSYFCSASFIDSRWLVTAAHCFPLNNIHRPDDFRVLSSPSEDLAQAAKSPLVAEKFCLHEDFTRGFIPQNDIALVKLKDAQPVHIGVVDRARDATLNGDTEATVSGWGDIAPDRVDPQSKLNVAPAKIVGNDVCMTDNHLSGHITYRMRCIDAGPPGPCTGDSGAPLVVQGGSPLLDGVLSTGACDVTKFAVFTRISEYAEWIDKIRKTEDKCVGNPQIRSLN